jgi:uncharacterized protein (UPF0147 family)
MDRGKGGIEMKRKTMEAANIINQAAIEAETAIRTLEDFDNDETIAIPCKARERIEQIKQTLQKATDDLSELAIKLV